MRYALLAGVEIYEPGSGITDVKYACRDVYGVGHALQKHCGFEEVRILADQDDQDFGMSRVGNPTDAAILNALTNAAARLKEDDLFFYLFTGHGLQQTLEQNVRTYLLAQNACFQRRRKDCDSMGEPRRLRSGGIELAELRERLSEVVSRSRVILLDCCRNDPEAGRGDRDNLMGETLARNLVSASTRDSVENSATILMMACHPGMRAWAWPEVKHGVFSYFVKAGIEGKAWSRNHLEARDLCIHVESELKRWSEKTGQIQRPYFHQLESPQPIILADRITSNAAKEASEVSDLDVALAKLEECQYRELKDALDELERLNLKQAKEEV